MIKIFFKDYSKKLNIKEYFQKSLAISDIKKIIIIKNY